MRPQLISLLSPPPIVALVGPAKPGKSTIGNVLLWEPTIGNAFKTGILECTALLTEPVVNASRVGMFTVYDAAGNRRNYPIEELVDYKVRETDQKIMLYCETSNFLRQARLVDTPGLDSTVKYLHNRKAIAFLATPENYDVLVHVINPRNPAVRLEANALLPTPRIVVINRIDEEIKWDASPEGVIQELVEQTRAALIENMTKTELMPTVLGCSAIVGMASFRWADEILEGILDLAPEIGDMQRLSGKSFFDNDERRALAEAASAALRSPYYDDPSYQPSFPAIRFALGLVMRESIRTPEALRQRLRVLSGIDLLRDTVLAAATDAPLLAMRRELLTDFKRYQTQADETKQALRQTRALLQNTRHLTEKHTAPDTWGSTQELRFFEEVRDYLAKQADSLAKQSHENRQRFKRAEAEYVSLGTDRVSKRLVEHSDSFSDSEKRLLLALLGGSAPMLDEAPVWLNTARKDAECGVRRFVCEHAFGKIQQHKEMDS